MRILNRLADRVRPALRSESRAVLWSFAALNVCLGVVLLAAPDNWYGPSWHYFPQLPHNGFGMGLCCCAIGGAQLVAMARNCSDNILSALFFLGGFVFWTAGIVLGAEGLLGHQGLMEAPFMLVLGGHKLALSAELRAKFRRGRA